MSRLVFLLMFSLPLLCKAQQSDFPKNYVGLFYVTGYYEQRFFENGYPIQNGVDFKSVGLNLARRLTKNIYVQSNVFSAGGSYFYLDAGIKLNSLVHHKLQPHAGLTIGTLLGIEESSNIYYSVGLDYHIAPMVVLQSSAFSSIGTYSQGLRIGAAYKF